MKIHSLNPNTMISHMNLYSSIMFSQHGITREDRELIATVVSIINNCDYCKLHHSTALNSYWKDEGKIKTLLENFERFDFSSKQKSMVEYATKLTKKPDSITEDDIKILRNNGLADQDILNLNLIVSYFNFVNRIALGLNVQFSEDEITGYNY